MNMNTLMLIALLIAATMPNESLAVQEDGAKAERERREYEAAFVAEVAKLEERAEEIQATLKRRGRKRLSETMRSAMLHALALTKNELCMLYGMHGGESRAQEAANEALEALREELVAGGNRPQIFFEMAQAHECAGSTDEAIEHYKIAIREDPSFGRAHGVLGNVYAKIGRHRNAKIMLERAVELDPDDFMSHFSLANVYAELGDVAAAREQCAILDELDVGHMCAMIEARTKLELRQIRNDR